MPVLRPERDPERRDAGRRATTMRNGSGHRMLDQIQNVKVVRFPNTMLKTLSQVLLIEILSPSRVKVPMGGGLRSSSKIHMGMPS
jgi:hypothetical protein